MIAPSCVRLCRLDGMGDRVERGGGKGIIGRWGKRSRFSKIRVYSPRRGYRLMEEGAKINIKGYVATKTYVGLKETCSPHTLEWMSRQMKGQVRVQVQVQVQLQLQVQLQV